MNRLAEETSPYLRQHRDNPVDWYPWGAEAFARARADDLPVFLSVGYSACHWCHVMAHESFEDPATASFMNAAFVNVKVDREERPDVDAVYMQAVQAMTGRGGWPMSVWLTPDGRPFYGGTYFPDTDRHGMPSFRRVLEAVAEAWRERRADVLGAAQRLTSVLDDDSLLRAGGLESPSLEQCDEAAATLEAQFEPRFGGFGHAPKFPHAMALVFLCQTLVRRPDDGIGRVLTTSLDGMARGGIHDQLGGGFSRYSVDERWLVPHFEKMLYDNALLVRAYLYGALLTGNERWRTVVEDTVGYVLRDLRDPDGGFYSAEDADSEGVEGRFYVWSAAEVREVCGDEAPVALRAFGVTDDGNFEGRNILHVADVELMDDPSVERARALLFERRATRVRPGLDDKVLLAWNALFAASLAEAGAAMDRRDWVDAARTNLRFLLSELRRDDGRFLRSWQASAPVLPGSGRARHLAYADDYAALLEALVTMVAVDGITWLAPAREVAAELLRLFHDSERSAFFTTGVDAEPLVVRPTDVQDNATPSATSLAAHGLVRLAALTGDASYAAVARAAISTLGATAVMHPSAFAHLLCAMERSLAPPLEVAIVGGRDDPRTAGLRAEVFGRMLPPSVAISADPDEGDGGSPLLEGRLAGDAPRAFVCEGFACQVPAGDPETLRAQLDAVVSRQRAAQ